MLELLQIDNCVLLEAICNYQSAIINYCMLSQEFIEQSKQRLLELQNSLTEELRGLSPHTELGNQEGDAASELEIDEVSQDLIARISSDLEKISKALAKIEAGTYGLDDEGNEISRARLEAIPFADHAI